MDLAGTIDVVTGGAAGMGAGISERLAAEGMHPVIVDLDETAVAKAGVIRFTACLALLRDTIGVRANCICPDLVDTPASRRSRAHMTPAVLSGRDQPPRHWEGVGKRGQRCGQRQGHTLPLPPFGCASVATAVIPFATWGSRRRR